MGRKERFGEVFSKLRAEYVSLLVVGSDGARLRGERRLAADLTEEPGGVEGVLRLAGVAMKGVETLPKIGTLREAPEIHFLGEFRERGALTQCS